MPGNGCEVRGYHAAASDLEPITRTLTPFVVIVRVKREGVHWTPSLFLQQQINQSVAPAPELPKPYFAGSFEMRPAAIIFGT